MTYNALPAGIQAYAIYLGLNPTTTSISTFWGAMYARLADEDLVTQDKEDAVYVAKANELKQTVYTARGTMSHEMEGEIRVKILELLGELKWGKVPAVAAVENKADNQPTSGGGEGRQLEAENREVSRISRRPVYLYYNHAVKYRVLDGFM